MIKSRRELLRICKNCLYYDKDKHNKYDLSNHYCHKLNIYVGNSEYMKKDCVVLVPSEKTK